VGRSSSVFGGNCFRARPFEGLSERKTFFSVGLKRHYKKQFLFFILFWGPGCNKQKGSSGPQKKCERVKTFFVSLFLCFLCFFVSLFLCFFVSLFSFFWVDENAHKNTKTQKHKNKETKTQKHKNTKTKKQKHKNTKTQKHMMDPKRRTKKKKRGAG
jgi:hypothetical protein